MFPFCITDHRILASDWTSENHNISEIGRFHPEVRKRGRNFINPFSPFTQGQRQFQFPKRFYSSQNTGQWK
jgi:hypothetical protein